MPRQAVAASAVAIWLAVLAGRAVGQPLSPPDVRFFETRVRPVLVESCFKCHGPDKQRGGLRLDSRAALLAGGDQGPALVPGHPEQSLLIRAINQHDELKMPPSKPLPARQVADLTQWVRQGAPWPGADAPAPPARHGTFQITDKDRAHWAFQPIRRPAVPRLERHANPDQAVDAFVLAGLEAKGLEPNGPADRRELIRRVSFDLTGLPPTPEAVATFVHDPDPAAYAKLIDRLLASPHYGERWGRHWLDLVRFAQTNGYERDGEKPFAWRYRDYVIRAFNDDKPYDRFVLEQLAGDELPDATDDARIATGFYRLGVWDDEPDDARQAEFDGLDDVMVATGAAFLGLTLGCARCHDHKFDPIPQADYYRLLAFFRNVRPYENAAYTADSGTYLPLGDREQARTAVAESEARVKKLEGLLKQAKTDDERKKLQERLKRAKTLKGLDWALGVRERGPSPVSTRVLIRGNAGTPGDEVQPAFLSVLGGAKPELPAPPPEATTCGRRLALARWIASPDNPLTARVIVNRLWQHHFGQGLVKSTGDFGRAGTPPTHPALLDWLAAELIDHGWSLKKLHRTILLSEAYQRSSRTDNVRAVAADPGNELLWRQSLRRLEAEAIRDTVLAVSGQLNAAMGGRGFFPRLDGEVLAGGSRPGDGWETSPDRERCRRSVYLYSKRTLVAPALDTFDFIETGQPVSDRPVTTVAPQALLLLNDEFLHEQAAALARRLLAEAGPDPRRQIGRAFELAFGRHPSEHEATRLLDYRQRQVAAFTGLRTRLSFRPNVPFSLSDGFLRNQLRPEDFLSGPRASWSYYPGRWGGSYEGIKAVDVRRGPFALWQGPTFADGTVTARLTLHNAAELGALLVRAAADGDVFHGYEVAFHPRRRKVTLSRHGADVAVLAEAARVLPTGKPLPVKIEVAGDRVRVWLGEEQPVLDVTDPQPLRTVGHLGVRSWGAAVTLDDLTVTAGGPPIDVATADVPAGVAAQRKDPERRALEAVCLLILNLNELVYVD
jgi:Protein of unknown function (DUF1553)/Protein of unknown function (DUF1549)/Planctomycete cytochrome C